MRVPAPQELTLAPAFTVLQPVLCDAPNNSARAFGVMAHAQRAPVWSPAVSLSAARVQQHTSFATVARVARGAVLAGCSALGVGYSVLL